MTAINNGTGHACLHARNLCIHIFLLSPCPPHRAHASSPPSRQSVDGMLHMHAPIDMNASLHTKRPGRYLIPDFPFGCERSPFRGASPRVFRAETLPLRISNYRPFPPRSLTPRYYLQSRNGSWMQVESFVIFFSLRPVPLISKYRYRGRGERRV